MQLQIEPLTSEAFAPFGVIIEQPAAAALAAGAGWQWWGEIVTLDGGSRPYAVGFLRLEPADRRFDWAERHMHSPEMIVPLDGACLLYVAPADHPEQPDRLPEPGRFRVFQVG